MRGQSWAWHSASILPPAHAHAGHAGPVLGLAFSQDGALLATASADATACIWAARSKWSCVAVLKGHSNVVNCVAFSGVGSALQLASCSSDNTAMVWSCGQGGWGQAAWSVGGRGRGRGKHTTTQAPTITDD